MRGFGELLLQPLMPSREITLGGAGTGFELTAEEFGALGNTFSKVTIGRADGAHEVNITSSLNFRDTTEIRTPLDGGSVSIGSGLAPITVQTVGRGDNLRITSGGDITVDGNLKTVGRGSLELLADFDGKGDGDLLIGQHLSARNKSVNIGSEFGAIRLQGENIAVGARVPGVRGAGFVSIASVGGDIGLRTNLDADADGGLAFQNARNSVKTAGLVEFASANHGGAADFIGGIISGRLGVNVHGFDSVSTTATQVKSSRLIAIEAMSETFKAGSAFTSLAEIQISGNAATGVLSVEKGATIFATKSILLDAADVQRARGSIVRAQTVTIHEI